MMKRSILIFLLLSLFTSLSSCSESSKQVTLTFVQHTFLGFSYDEKGESNGYYFKNDELAKTSFQYDLGYHLTSDDIHSFNSFNLSYDVPELNGDGYWSFTFFTTVFDEETGFSYEYLKPCEINEDMTVHFAIYG